MTDAKSKLDKLFAAHKSITTTNSLGDSKLTPEKQSQFIRTVTKTTPLLDESRRINMQSHTYDIDRISLAGRMLKPVQETEEAKEVDGPNFATNKLVAEELAGWFGITDQTLEDNIERGGLENTIIGLAGNRAGIDLAELFIKGDKDGTGDLAVLDGWLKKAANSIGSDVFDPQDPEDLFARMIEVMDKTYLRDPADWTIWTTWNIADHYRDGLRGRDTAMGDAAQTQFGGLAFKGFTIQYDPSLPDGTALLAPTSNLVWGVHRDVRIEPERNAKARRTDFVVSVRADCHYEDENAVVVAEGYTGPTGETGA